MRGLGVFQGSQRGGPEAVANSRSLWVADGPQVLKRVHDRGRTERGKLDSRFVSQLLLGAGESQEEDGWESRPQARSPNPRLA